MSVTRKRAAMACTNIGAAARSAATHCLRHRPGRLAGAGARSAAAQVTVVSGPITGFGSVIVNGLTLDTSRADIRIDGRPGRRTSCEWGR